MTNSTSRRTRRVLLLSGPKGEDAELLRFLNEHSVVRIVQTVDEALDAIRSQSYDLIVSESDNLPALADASVRLAAELALDQPNEGVGLFDGEGQVLWADDRFREFPEEVISWIRSAAQEAKDAAGGTQHVQQRISEQYFDIALTPIRSADQRVERLVAVVRDVSDLGRLQGKLNAIDGAGRALVCLDADSMKDMDVPARLALLEQTIIHYCHDLLQYDHFAVRLLDKQSNRLDTVLAGGFSEEAKQLELFASAEAGGITGYVAATGQAYICTDTQQDPRYLPGLEDARSSLTVPLRLHDQVIGVFNIESERVHAFSEQDRQFAEIFGRYIALALNILQLLVVERRSTFDSLGEDVAAELESPLGEIIAEVTLLAGQLRDNDEAMQHLRAIMGYVATAREALQAVTEPTGIAGLAPATPEADPILEGRRILIAEDEDIIRETLTEVLTGAGAITVPVHDGDEAILAIQQQHFDLVLTDIKMPKKTGYQVFAAVKQVAPDCPVVLLTGFGYDPNHSIVRASKEGLAGVLFKPFKVEQLLDQVRAALRSAAA